MSDAPRSARSFAKIEEADLERLSQLALEKIEQTFQRQPDRRAIYENELAAICLCQGAAEHYVHYGTRASRGIHDFDVWAFFERQDERGFWNRKPVTADFGPSKFGRSPLDPKTYKGRRVDVFWRAIDKGSDQLDPFSTIKDYFLKPATDSSRALSKKPAVFVWPELERGYEVWVPPPIVRPPPPRFEWTR